MKEPVVKRFTAFFFGGSVFDAFGALQVILNIKALITYLAVASVKKSRR